MSEDRHTFVLSDESVNTYGFRVLTGGLSLERFEKNPVMLYSHDNMVLPIGRWVNIRVEGKKLLADAEFDEGDEFAMEVKRKVEAGLLRCCSIGFSIKTRGEGADGVPEVTESELLEGSICAVGANPNARKLTAVGVQRSAVSGQWLVAGCRCTVVVGQQEETGKQPDNNPKTTNSMNEQEQAKMDQLESQVAQLTKENQSLTAERDELAGTIRTMRESENEALLNAAVSDGRIGEGEKGTWKELLSVTPESAKSALAALKPRQSLSAMLEEQKGKAGFAGKSWAELDKSGQLSAYKEKDPEGFKELYRKTFGAEYKEN